MKKIKVTEKKHRIGIKQTFYEENGIYLLVEEVCGKKYYYVRCSREKDQLFFPTVTICDGHITIDFHKILVFSKADSNELVRNIEKIWEFLDNEVIKKIIASN